MKKKTKIAASLMVAFALLFSAGVMLQTKAAKASSSWKDYFTVDEGKAIKKMVNSYIINQIEDDNEKWESVIGKDQVGNDISKRKVYTGTVTCSAAWADAVSAGVEKVYYKKISIPELEISSKDIGDINFYTKDTNETLGEVWVEEDWIYFKDGEVWFMYADEDNDSWDPIAFSPCSFSDYKIVVSY